MACLKTCVKTEERRNGPREYTTPQRSEAIPVNSPGIHTPRLLTGLQPWRVYRTQNARPIQGRRRRGTENANRPAVRRVLATKRDTKRGAAWRCSARAFVVIAPAWQPRDVCTRVTTQRNEKRRRRKEEEGGRRLALRNPHEKRTPEAAGCRWMCAGASRHVAEVSVGFAEYCWMCADASRHEAEVSVAFVYPRAALRSRE